MTSSLHASGPIGIFDSGVGGLTVLEAVLDILPDEDYVYYADSGNCPYGDRSKDEILELASDITSFLAGAGCKLIVVACNTITTNIIDELRDRFSLPIVGMEPAIKPAARYSRSGRVAVLATKGTLNGALYNRTRQTHAADVHVVNIIGTGLVELIEQDRIDTPEMRLKLETIVRQVEAEGADTLVLGCTHYNYLSAAIRSIAGPQLEIINSASAVAKRVKDLLESEGLRSHKHDRRRMLYSTGDLTVLQSIVKRLDLGPVEILAPPVSH